MHRVSQCSSLSIQRKYPEATDYAICSLIGGFFFLRFINPAVVTPQAYMLVDGVPAKHPRRTLTLVCAITAQRVFLIHFFRHRSQKCCKIWPTNPHMPKNNT